MGRPRKDIDMESVRLRSDLLRKARMIVALRRNHQPGLTLGDYLAKILSPQLEKDYRAEKKRFAEEP